MIISRLLFDVSFLILLISIAVVFTFGYRSWRRFRQQQFFWHLVVIGSFALQLLLIIFNNYLYTADSTFAEGSLGFILDDRYWILVFAFFRIVLITIMIYGINRLCLHFLPIPVKGKRRILFFLLMVLVVSVLGFFVLVRISESNPVYINAEAVASGLIFPIGCLIAGTQAAVLLILSILLRKTVYDRKRYIKLFYFTTFILFPVIDFIWLEGSSVPSYMRISYFSVIPLIVSFILTMADKDSEKQDSLIEDRSRLEVICGRFEISAREYDVLKLIIAGYNHQGIADKLFISINTVKSHLQSIYKKMKVSGKIQLMLKINSM